MVDLKMSVKYKTLYFERVFLAQNVKMKSKSNNWPTKFPGYDPAAVAYTTITVHS